MEFIWLSLWFWAIGAVSLYWGLSELREHDATVGERLNSYARVFGGWVFLFIGVYFLIFEVILGL